MATEKQKFGEYGLYVQRRKKLIETLLQKHPNISPQSHVLLCADFEQERYRFRQESSFFYYTGLEEPGVVLTIDMNAQAVLWKPHCTTARSAWIYSPIPLEEENAARLGFTAINVLGEQCAGYQFHPFFPRKEYQALLEWITHTVQHKGSLLTLCPQDPSSYVAQRLLLSRLNQYIPDLQKHLIDISYEVHAMRRTKEKGEIEKIYKAIEITHLAHEAAARAIQAEVSEAEVQASIEYIFTAANARTAFPSIVAGGKNGTILHYVVNNAKLQAGDLVVVDIGAEHEYYCADLTRTYPVSGAFTARQKELYTIVLDAQEYVARKAAPGYWISNKEKPEKSLYHLALSYLEKAGGYDRYFIHGIGHFVGLDVHDVGDYTQPLKEGDVFTIEPGIYIPQEGIGIRIEDDYWVVPDGAICLSEQLPKQPEDIEKLVTQQFE
jgi:Xaa-Pro aminopeptidase